MRILTRTRIAQIGATNHRDAGQQIRALILSVPGDAGHHFRIERKHAAMLGQRLVTAAERTVLHLIQLQHGLFLQQRFDAGRIVHAGKGYQQLRFSFGASTLLHRRFRQTQTVDLALNGLHGLIQRVLFQLERRGRLHIQAVIGGVDGGENPIREIVARDGANVFGAVGGHALDGDLDLVGVLEACQIVAGNFRKSDVLLAELFLQPVDHGFRVGHERILQLDLQHQMRPALQVETQMDVVLPVLHQLGARPGNADDAVDADQDQRNDDPRFDLEIPIHAFRSWPSARAGIPAWRRNNLSLLVLRNQTGHGAPVHLQFDVVGFDSNNQSIITDRNDGAHDSARRHHRLSVLEVLEHRRRLFLLALHGHEHQKVEDTDDQDQREEPDDGVGRGGRLEQNQRVYRHFSQ